MKKNKLNIVFDLPISLQLLTSNTFQLLENESQTAIGNQQFHSNFKTVGLLNRTSKMILVPNMAFQFQCQLYQSKA